MRAPHSPPRARDHCDDLDPCFGSVHLIRRGAADLTRLWVQIEPDTLEIFLPELDEYGPRRHRHHVIVGVLDDDAVRRDRMSGGVMVGRGDVVLECEGGGRRLHARRHDGRHDGAK